MKNIWQAVFLIVGSIIGAGFASGRELSLFFAEFGYSSLYFLPIVFVLFYYSFKLFLTVGSEHKYTNIFELNKKTNSSIFFNISIFLVYIIYSSAMFSGSVEILSSTFLECPTEIIYTFVFLVTYFVLQCGLKGLYKINAILIPLIIILLLIYSIYSTFSPITTLPYIPSSEKAYILPISIIIYVMANVLLSYFIVSQVGYKLSKQEIKKSSFIASFIICFVILICIICLITNGAVVMDASMPFVILTLRLGEPFPLIFMLVLFFGVITSLFTCLHTACSTFNNKNQFLTKEKTKKKSRTTILCCFVVLLISLLGFEKIVNYGYPIIGLLGISLIIKFNKTSLFLKKSFKSSNNIVHTTSKHTQKKYTSHN